MTKDSKTLTHAELLKLECDILVPAALEGDIRADNAASVKARIIVEGANGPTTAESEDEVNSRLQDIMDNAFHEVLEVSQREKVNMRDAAYMVAIDRLARAITIRGTFP